MADKGIENLHGAQITTSTGLVLAPGLNRVTPKQHAEVTKDRFLKRFFRKGLLRSHGDAVPPATASAKAEGGKGDGETKAKGAAGAKAEGGKG